MQRLCVILLAFPAFLLAQQPDTLRTDPPDETQELIEDFLQNTDGEGAFDFNTIFEQLEDFRRNPINLNKANEASLRELRLLSDAQILDLLNYRQEVGELIAVHELQAVPGFDLSIIRLILPYVTVSGDVDDYQIPFSKMLAGGQHELYLRWSRILEQQKGFTTSETNASRYLGDPNQLYFRYRHAYGTRLSYGITGEKDRGEEFFKGSNEQGFDFYSAHFFVRDYNKNIKAIALGDYSVSFGQGLVLFTGFGIGKSSSPMTVKRTGRVLRPYTSANEVNFFRGVATTLAFGENVEATIFASSRGRDANLIVPNDTSESDIEIRSFTSFDLDGLHRTGSEIADENALQQFTVGGNIKLSNRYGHIGLNVLYDQFDKTLEINQKPYNRFYFSDDRLMNASLDYSYLWRNFNFFGETAMSDNGALASINGILIGLDRKVDLAVLYRYFPRDYQALNANPFAETSGARNEQGLYIGLEIRPIRNWTLSTYFDAWKHPWIRFDAAAPSRGFEYRTRLAYEQRRRLRTYLEVREEVKERNSPEPANKTEVLTDIRTFQMRLHAERDLSKSLELRSRIDWGFSQVGESGQSNGFAIYQDILFRPIGFPLSFTARYSIFDTQGFETRFYSFENDLLYNFSIPAYYNRGTRFYLNIRCRIGRNLTVEGRVAQTYWKNQDTIGSSLEEISGQNRTQVSGQIRYKF
ncbi:MAG: helix-hairpin-helix domain-containing protein [Saprospiraceae bacterium]|nr:helix-hairpin-helix domain-containing protein [Saprospiraceae bacterium]